MSGCVPHCFGCEYKPFLDPLLNAKVSFCLVEFIVTILLLMPLTDQSEILCFNDLIISGVDNPPHPPSSVFPHCVLIMWLVYSTFYIILACASMFASIELTICGQKFYCFVCIYPHKYAQMFALNQR